MELLRGRLPPVGTGVLVPLTPELARLGRGITAMTVLARFQTR